MTAGCWPGPHLAVTPSLLAEHLRVYAGRAEIRIEVREKVSSIGLYISTVTSSAARDQWEEGRSDHHSHINISPNGTSNREQINQGIRGPTVSYIHYTGIQVQVHKTQ